MLSTLSVGLASGVGLFGIALASTIFLVVTLWIIEGFETRVRTFLLTVKLGDKTSARRADVEQTAQKGRGLARAADDLSRGVVVPRERRRVVEHRAPVGRAERAGARRQGPNRVERRKERPSPP